MRHTAGELREAVEPSGLLHLLLQLLVLVLGELSLDGSLQPMRGVLPQLCGTLDARLHTAIVPSRNAAEAGLVERGCVLCAESLAAIADHFSGQRALPRAGRTPFCPAEVAGLGDLTEVRGQAGAHPGFRFGAHAEKTEHVRLRPGAGGLEALDRQLRSRHQPTLDLAAVVDHHVDVAADAAGCGDHAGARRGAVHRDGEAAAAPNSAVSVASTSSRRSSCDSCDHRCWRSA